MMIVMRSFAATVLTCLLLAANNLAQDWKQVHKADDAKWAKETGLDPGTVHKLWRLASSNPDEKDDESRIANLDIEGLAERHHILLVTYAGEKNCLTLTVFNQLSGTKFEKLWSMEQSPDGTGFCDTALGSPDTSAAKGTIGVRVPDSVTGGSTNYKVYTYEWNGITYRFAGLQQMQDR
jgi:hypothetical protein